MLIELSEKNKEPYDIDELDLFDMLDEKEE